MVAVKSQGLSRRRDLFIGVNGIVLMNLFCGLGFILLTSRLTLRYFSINLWRIFLLKSYQNIPSNSLNVSSVPIHL